MNVWMNQQVYTQQSQHVLLANILTKVMEHVLIALLDMHAQVKKEQSKWLTVVKCLDTIQMRLN